MSRPDLRELPAVRRLASEPGVHAVGGAVRDVLLGRAPREVDFVVDGDAVALARRLGGEVTAHDRFGTATVRLGDEALDLASARTERYPRPGALPEVRLGATIADDLRRRDFTVNAIAVRLADGERLAVPGALDDLRAGVLRVLHEGSFEDDPTRMLRMLRYGARLGFAPDAATAALAREAVAGGALATVSAPRLGSELALLLREPQPDALVALGALAPGLLPGLDPDPSVIARALELAPPDARADLVALAAAFPGGHDELEGRLRELGFPARDAVLAARAAAGSDQEPLEAAVVAAARGSEAAGRWVDDLRYRRLAITGDDLLAAGLSGPAVGRGLAAARAAMLDGSAPDRRTQLAVALRG